MCALALSESILKYMIPWLDLDWPLNPEEIYGREGPLVLEIGFGNGGFLVEQAQNHPEALFLGIERSWGAAQRLFKRLEQTGLQNVRVIQGGAEFLLQHAFKPDSIEKVYINFSDPWPKERHHNRRLIQQEFVKLLGERLVADGQVTIATDHAEYAEWICELLEGQSALVSCFDRTRVNELPGRSPTKYERKATDTGVPINYFVWRREACVSLPPVIVQKVEVAGQHLLAVFLHLLEAHAGIHLQIFERFVEALEMLVELENTMAEGARHIERAIAIFKAAVAERDHGAAFRHDLSVDVYHPFVGQIRHVKFLRDVFV